MVMGNRPEVRTAPAPIALVDVVGLAQQSINALARVPFRRPWQGVGTLMGNLGASVTREVVRTFMGYSSSLPIDEFRSIELLLDSLCGLVMPPVVSALDVDTEEASVGGVPGIWYRPRAGRPPATILYLHGGGYIGTSPRMYAAFTATLARETGCEVFVADYRLAPEFPFPADVEDALRVLEALVADGIEPDRIFLAGDSGGGGVASTAMLTLVRSATGQVPGGMILFSPEVDLKLDEPSVTENAPFDVLPWNIPTSAYLHGFDASSEFVSPVNANLRGYPPTFVAWGDEEMFRDPIRRFVERLAEAGVDHVAMEERGMFHVFPILMPWADQSRRVYRAVRDFVHQRLPGVVSTTPPVGPLRSPAR
ncbi:alpha/beta hydrolase [Rhabdothermincola sp.]|uniref:alpha/beta hydrolase n=1 Tax=Rhabdothermincola sp. TaxID=2820405 RepID=UPI003FA6BDF2